jgi:hypothetical protein
MWRPGRRAGHARPAWRSGGTTATRRYEPGPSAWRGPVLFAEGCQRVGLFAAFSTLNIFCCRPESGRMSMIFSGCVRVAGSGASTSVGSVLFAQVQAAISSGVPVVLLTAMASWLTASERWRRSSRFLPARIRMIGSARYLWPRESCWRQRRGKSRWWSGQEQWLPGNGGGGCSYRTYPFDRPGTGRHASRVAVFPEWVPQTTSYRIVRE